METKIFTPSGGLDFDSDILADGDYLSARNIVTSVSKTGGDGAIKKLESITEWTADLSGTLVDPTFIRAVKDENQNIYALLADATHARIVKIGTDATATDVITRYAHNNGPADPDFKIIGKTLVWNYYGDGIPLSWNTERASVEDPALEDIALIKRPGVFPIIFHNEVDEFSPNVYLREAQFQFAYAYRYDNNERSAISSFSKMTSIEDNISAYIINKPEQEQVPSYADKVDIYVRAGNIGVWKRFKTLDVADFTSTMDLRFLGVTSEAIDSRYSSNQFDYVPLTASAIEVTDGRILIGNYSDALGDGAAPPIVEVKRTNTDISIYANYVFGAFGLGFRWMSPGTKGYIDGSDNIVLDATSRHMIFKSLTEWTDTVEITSEFMAFKPSTNSWIRYQVLPDFFTIDTEVNANFTGEIEHDANLAGWVHSRNKPWSGLGSQAVGIAYFDDWMRTRGVEAYDTFDSSKNYGNTAQYASPTVRISGAAPSWAKYYKVLVTKNLDVDWFIRMKTSHVFYEYIDSENTTKHSPAIDSVISGFNSSMIRLLVFDISDFISKGYTYTFNEGDVVIYRGSHLKITGSSGQFIYTESYEQLDDPTDSSEVITIYSPSKKSDNLLFYEVGIVRPVTDFFSGVIVFTPKENNEATDEDVELPVYSIPSQARIGVIEGDCEQVSHDAVAYFTPTDNRIDATGTMTSASPSGSASASYLMQVSRFLPITSVWNTNIGKPLPLQNENQLTKQNYIRHSGRLIQNTKLNEINYFHGLDFKDTPYEYGAITTLQRTSKMEAEGDVVLVICEVEAASIYISENLITDSQGRQLSVASDKVIGTIRPLKGGFGCKHKKSIVPFDGSVYWWSDNRKAAVRYNLNGLFPISKYKARSYFQAKSGDAIGFFDPFYNMYHLSYINSGESIAFREGKDRWVGFFDFEPEAATHIDDTMILFKDGKAYKALGDEFATYFGVANDGVIKFQVRSNTPTKLEGITIKTKDNYVDWETSNFIKDGILDALVQNEKGQQTTLTDRDFIMEDRYLYSQFYNNELSPVANPKIFGDYMVGAENTIELTLKDNTLSDRIYAVGVRFSPVAGHIL